MKILEVKVARIYLTESKSHLETLMKRLHDWEKLRGVTVFRGISGFGASGKVHTTTLVELSTDLPVVVEFYDEPDKVDEILEHLQNIIDPDHMVSWMAAVGVKEE